MTVKKQQAKAAGESLIFLVVLGGILVALNVLGVFAHARVDTTEQELFSLSDGSKRLAGSLSDVMEIRAYFSEDQAPVYSSTERYVRDLLAEYRDASGGKVTVRFINPVEDEEREAAERDGVVRAQDQVLEADSFSVKEAYRGLSFHYLGDTRAIPLINDTAGLEYEITQVIKELSGEKVKIGVLGGHEGPTLAEGLTRLKSYLPTYDIQEVKADKEIPSDIKALLIVHPETAITEPELRHIDQYVMRGGSLGVFGGSLKIDMGQGAMTATKADSGLNALLEKWGVKIDDAIVADAQCRQARMPTNLGIPMLVPYPPVPIALLSEDQREHPAMFRLPQVVMAYPSPIELNGALDGDKEVKRTVLAESTKTSWLMQGESIDLKPRQEWMASQDGPYALAVALEGKLPSAFADDALTSSEPSKEGDSKVEAPARAEKPVHVLVMGSGLFLRDEFMPPPQENSRKVFGGGIAVALNVIDWLANDSDLIAIRAKTVEDPALEVPATIKQAEASAREASEEQDEEKFQAAVEKHKAATAAWERKKNMYRWGNTLALPAVFALFGVARWRTRKAKKANLTL